MGTGHSHATARTGDRARGGSRTAVIACTAIIVPLALATLAALLLMWPDDLDREDQPSLPKMTGSVDGVRLKPCPKPLPAEPGGAEPGGAGPGGAEPGGQGPAGKPRPIDPRKCGEATVRITSGAESGRTVQVPLNDGPGSHLYEAGDDVVLLHNPELTDSPYQFSDHQRSKQLWIIMGAFVLAVIAFGRWRGLRALIGLAITFTLLLLFLIPAIVAGASPLWAAIVCAAAIMLTVLYLTHGPTVETSVAVVGTLGSLTLTGLLATTAIGMTHLNGITDDSSFFLTSDHQINAQGILLASIIIGALGVLDDVTVTQSVTVSEIAAANPSYRFAQLYRSASRVGRAHIASVINTIILAYAGASLPLLLLFSIGGQPLGDIVTGPIVAQEIVRSVAGTLGLIAAVPITTALAALTQSPGRRRSRTSADAEPPAVLTDRTASGPV